MSARFGLAANPALALCLVLAACETAPPQPAPQQTASAEDLDPFVVAINAGRWGVLIDKAIEGAREAPEPSAAIAETDQARADRSVKDGAAQLL